MRVQPASMHPTARTPTRSPLCFSAPSLSDVADRAAAARTLTSRFSSSGLKGHALLRELMRHQELVKRELIFKTLAPTRETLLGQLEQQLEALRDDFETRSTATGGGKGKTSGARVGKNLPRSVEHLVLSKQVGDKVGEILSAVKPMLGDLPRCTSFEAKAQDLHQYMADYQQQNF